MSCQMSDLRKTLKYSQSWTLYLMFEYPTLKVRRRPSSITRLTKLELKLKRGETKKTSIETGIQITVNRIE